MLPARSRTIVLPVTSEKSPSASLIHRLNLSAAGYSGISTFKGFPLDSAHAAAKEYLYALMTVVLSKASSPIFVTEAGIVTSDNEVLPKAAFPMPVTDLGMVTLARFAHSKKALSLISVNPSGISTPVRPDLKNVPNPILLRPAGRDISVRF